jgi:hypothetical protein
MRTNPNTLTLFVIANANLNQFHKSYKYGLVSVTGIPLLLRTTRGYSEESKQHPKTKTEIATAYRHLELQPHEAEKPATIVSK